MPSKRSLAINLNAVDSLDWSHVKIEKMDGRNNW